MNLRTSFIAIAGLLFGAAAHAQTANAPDTEVNFYVSRNVAPGPKIRLQINTKNLPSIRVKLSRIDAMSWLSLEPDKRVLKPRAVSTDREFMVNLLAKGQSLAPPPQDNYLSKQINLPVLKPGLYLLESNSSAKGENWAVIMVTNLAIVSKRSPKRLLTWVTDFQNGKPIAGLRCGSSRDDRCKAP